MEVFSDESNPAELARKALKYYLEKGCLPGIPDPVPPEYSSRAGAFVSLKKAGRLRGCIGTIEPVHKNLAEEIAANAVSAALRDPRFPPVTGEELQELDFSVDVLGPLTKVLSLDELDVKQFGVVVKSGAKSGLLLPDLEGVKTVEEQVDIARRKAGILPGEQVELYRFKVERYRENNPDVNERSG